MKLLQLQEFKNTFRSNLYFTSNNNISQNDKTTFPDSIYIIKKEVENEKNPGKMYNYIGRIFEQASNDTLAGICFAEAVKKYKNNFSIELIDSLVNLQNILKNKSHLKFVNDIESKMRELLRHNVLPARCTSDEKLRMSTEISQIELNLNIAKKLQQAGKYEDALIFYDDLIRNATLYLPLNDTKWGLLQELGGDIYKSNNLLEKSNNEYSQSIKYCKKEDLDKISNLENKIAINHIAMGYHELAKSELQNTLNQTISVGNIIENFLIKSRMYLSENEITLFENAINLSNILANINNKKLPTEAYIYNSILEKQKNNIQKSNDFCQKGLEHIKKENKMSSVNSIILSMLLASNNYLLYSQTNDKSYLNNSIVIYKNALQIAEYISDKNLIFYTNYALANIHFHEKSTKQAEQYAQKAWNMSKKLKNGPNKEQALILLGNIYYQAKSLKAFSYLQAVRDCMLERNANINEIDAITRKIIDIAKLKNDTVNIQKYTSMLSGNNTNDMIYLAEQKMMNKNYTEAAKYYTDIQKSDSSSAIQKAIANIQLGIIDIECEKLQKGIEELEYGCNSMYDICNQDNFKNKENTIMLLKTLNILGEQYYTKYTSKYEQAARTFKKIAKILDSFNIKDETTNNSTVENAKEINQYFRMRINARVAASYYKAEKYWESEQYLLNYIKNIVADEKFNYSTLIDDNFINNITNSYPTNKVHRLTNALEMLGVINVKRESFNTAIQCFKSALNIKRNTVGENISFAQDYNAIARILMIGMWPADASEIRGMLEKSIEILKKELGENHPEVIKEQEFLGSFFGSTLASFSKYGHIIFQNLKEELGFTNKHKEEIIKNFHLKFQELKICE